MNNTRKDHTMEFPTPVQKNKSSFISKMISIIKSGYIYSTDKK